MKEIVMKLGERPKEVFLATMKNQDIKSVNEIVLAHQSDVGFTFYMPLETMSPMGISSQNILGLILPSHFVSTIEKIKNGSLDQEIKRQIGEDPIGCVVLRQNIKKLYIYFFEQDKYESVFERERRIPCIEKKDMEKAFWSLHEALKTIQVIKML